MAVSASAAVEEAKRPIKERFEQLYDFSSELSILSSMASRKYVYVMRSPQSALEINLIVTCCIVACLKLTLE